MKAEIMNTAVTDMKIFYPKKFKIPIANPP